MKNFEGSIGVVLLNFLKLIIHFVRSASQLCWVFDLRALSYLEHCPRAFNFFRVVSELTTKAHRLHIYLHLVNKLLPGLLEYQSIIPEAERLSKN